MSYNSTDPHRGQALYTNSGIDDSILEADHHISFIPVPLTHNVDVSPGVTGGYPVQTTISSSSVNSSGETRPRPQIMILERMKQMRDEGKYCDLFIDVKGMKFLAHKSLLAAWSPYFDEALTSTNYVEKDLLIIHYDSYEVFSDLLEFFYTGNILPRDTNFLQLLHLAVSFDIELLKSYCEEFLRCNLHLGNFVSTYFLSRKYSLESLEEFIVAFLQSNLSDAVKQSDFLHLKAEKFHALLSKGSMLKLKPEMKLFLVISWVGFDVQAREKFLVLLLKHIDWSSVASDFLLEISRTENFFTTHESSLYLLLQTLFSSGISLGPYRESFAALRQTYSHLLSEVVTSGVILPEVDEFVAVTAIGTTTRTIKLDAAVNTNQQVTHVLDPLPEVQYTCTRLTTESHDILKPEENLKEHNFNESFAHATIENINEGTGAFDDNHIKHDMSNDQTETEPEQRKSKRAKNKKTKIMSKDKYKISKDIVYPERRSSPRISNSLNDSVCNTQSGTSDNNLLSIVHDETEQNVITQDTQDEDLEGDRPDEKISEDEEHNENNNEEDESYDSAEEEDDLDEDYSTDMANVKKKTRWEKKCK